MHHFISYHGILYFSTESFQHSKYAFCGKFFAKTINYQHASIFLHPKTEKCNLPQFNEKSAKKRGEEKACSSCFFEFFNATFLLKNSAKKRSPAPLSEDRFFQLLKEVDKRHCKYADKHKTCQNSRHYFSEK